MSEYIKREDALNQAITVTHYDGKLGGVCDHQYVRVEDINAIPAADVEPVARCKDCEYSGKIDSIFQTWCKKDMRRVNNDFYCAHGKERER